GGFCRDAGLGQIISAMLVVTLPELVLLLFRQLAPSRAQFLVKHAHRLAGKTLMLTQIKITAGGDAFEFVALHLTLLVLLAEREFEQNVRAGAGVMRQFFGGLDVKPEGFA